MKIKVLAVIILVLFAVTPNLLRASTCGNNICDKSETALSCAKDCAAKISRPKIPLTTKQQMKGIEISDICKTWKSILNSDYEDVAVFTSLYPFNEKIFVGTGGGNKVLTFNATNNIIESSFLPNEPFVGSVQIRTFASADNELYAGGAGVYKYNKNDNTWTSLPGGGYNTVGPTSISALSVFKDMLIAGGSDGFYILYLGANEIKWAKQENDSILGDVESFYSNENKLYIGAASGVFVWEPGKFEQLGQSWQNECSEYINSVIKFKGNVYAGTAKGICKFEDNSWKKVFDGGLKGDTFEIYKDTLYVGIDNLSSLIKSGIYKTTDGSTWDLVAEAKILDLIISDGIFYRSDEKNIKSLPVFCLGLID